MDDRTIETRLAYVAAVAGQLGVPIAAEWRKRVVANVGLLFDHAEIMAAAADAATDPAETFRA